MGSDPITAFLQLIKHAGHGVWLQYRLLLLRRRRLRRANLVLLILGIHDHFELIDDDTHFPLLTAFVSRRRSLKIEIYTGAGTDTSVQRQFGAGVDVETGAATDLDATAGAGADSPTNAASYSTADVTTDSGAG